MIREAAAIVKKKKDPAETLFPQDTEEGSPAAGAASLQQLSLNSILILLYSTDPCLSV